MTERCIPEHTARPDDVPHLRGQLILRLPGGGEALDPISLVCKVTEANGRPAVKLSDNPEKATGDPTEIARYLRVFGAAGRHAHPVSV